MNEQNQPQPNQTSQQPSRQQSATTSQDSLSTSASQKGERAASEAAGSAGAERASSIKKDQGARRKKFLIGCVSIFGCSFFLFVALVFVFLGFGGGESQIAAMLGVREGEVINLLIVLVNLFLGLLSFIAFIVLVVGLFKLATVKKDDKPGKRKAFILTFLSLGTLVFLIFVWIFAYLFLSQKRVPTTTTTFVTEPADTTSLTAPITIKFDGSPLVDTRLFRPLTYKWEFGDGTAAVGNPQTHTYRDKGSNDGRFDATLTVTASHRTTGEEAQQSFAKVITIANVEAQAVIVADPVTGDAPLTVAFDASDSIDPDGDIQAYEWDFDEDDDFDDATGKTAKFTFEKIGTYTVKLRITDSQGESVVAERDIEALAPNTPVARIEVEGVEGNILYVNEQYAFSGANSSSPRGTIKEYKWNFGDGSQAVATRTATHTFAQTGTYEVALTVTDNDNQKGEAAVKFRVGARERPPRAKIETDPQAGAEGIVAGKIPLSIVFNASGSIDPDNNIVEYAWDFDGDSETDSANIQAAHIFEQSGLYEVTLIVHDSQGNEGNASIFVRAESPGLQAHIAADPTSGEVPLTVAFDASGSSYPEENIVSYEWDFGDGTPPRIDTATVTHRYTAIGSFTARVTAIAGDGARASKEILVHIRPVAVSACFTATRESGEAPLTVTLDPTCSTGTITRFRWDFGGLSVSRDRKPTFTFEEAGEYEVKLEVSDNQDVIDTFSKTITVE